MGEQHDKAAAEERPPEGFGAAEASLTDPSCVPGQAAFQKAKAYNDSLLVQYQARKQHIQSQGVSSSSMLLLFSRRLLSNDMLGPCHRHSNHDTAAMCLALHRPVALHGVTNSGCSRIQCPHPAHTCTRHAAHVFVP